MPLILARDAARIAHDGVDPAAWRPRRAAPRRRRRRRASARWRARARCRRARAPRPRRPARTGRTPAPGRRRAARALVDDVHLGPVAVGDGEQPHRRTGRGDVEGVGDEVVDDLGHAVGSAQRGAPAAPTPRGARRRRRPAAPTPRARSSTNAAERRPASPWRPRRAGRRGRGRATRRPGAPCRATSADGGVDVVAAVERLEPEAQRGERRAQLVAGVGDEVVLGGHELLEPGRHAVERRGQRAHLRRALVGGGPAAEVARRRGAGGAPGAGAAAGSPSGRARRRRPPRSPA